ncbi:MBL fold metallo-hydrolase [Zwartia vadi]|uniref:MBL fold metallo-hydrolase n=1 Tax=Zwartia vadi TaxID=3058168 RepID=UPI0025B3021C|nr:MBL fold metallo-hydrolase [Zwartia vadi]MDN3986964.1 MBL fold metallo-hydrolase [Zwartia vadi]
MITRLKFLGVGIAAAATLMFSPVWAQTAPDLGTPTLPTPGFKKLKVGEIEVISLNDGAARRPLAAEFVKNAPLDEVKALLASQNLPTNYIDVPFTPFLIVNGNQRYLMDTGFANNGGPTTGKLIENMAAAGYKPEDINNVVISHFHGDHINGLLYKDGSLVYPNAKVHVPSEEYDFWMDKERLEKAPAGLKAAMTNAQRVFNNIPADRLVKFKAGSEVAPGITSVAAFGHTPGHSLFTVKSGGQSFIYVADLTNVPALFARNPDWAVVFDMDPEMARQSRRKIFDMIVKEKMMAGGFHFPFPAMGTITQSGNGYQFNPVK